MTETTGCDCATLESMNKETRKSLKGKSNAKPVVGKNSTGKVTGEGTTVSSMCFKGPKTQILKTAHNSAKALAVRDNGLEKGGAPGDRKAGRSKLCKKAKHKHAPPYNQKSGHTEARLLAALSREPGGFPKSGTLTLKIDWKAKSKKGKSSPMPCKSCHKLLCAAAKCGVTVYLCDKKNKKKKLSKKHCPDSTTKKSYNESYKELQKTMRAGKSKAGR